MTPTLGRRHFGCTILASGRAHDLPGGRPQVGMRQTPQQPAESGIAMFYEILAGASQNTLCNVRHYNSARDNQFSFMASNGETKWVFVGDYVFFLPLPAKTETVSEGSCRKLCAVLQKIYGPFGASLCTSCDVDRR